jgi:hypothetical protein
MKRIGKKGQAWNNARARLKQIFYRLGITTCELMYPGCWYDNALSFCHRMKRRKILDDTELMFVALGCTPCHDILERKSPQEMYDEITRIREEKPIN